MRKATAILLPLLLVGATVLAGCTSFADFAEKKGVVKLYVDVKRDSGVRDFRFAEVTIERLTMKTNTPEGSYPMQFEPKASIDLAAVGAPTQVFETRMDVGRYDLTAFLITLKGAVMRDGTETTIAVNPAPYEVTKPITFNVGRAEETALRLTLDVKLNGPETPGPDGEYYLTWVPTGSGVFTP